MKASKGGGLKGIVENFSFANQRYESEEAPTRKIACTLMASILFLTSEVDDKNRQEKEQRNAAEILSVFNAEDLTLFGLESDLASCGTEFLRFFDVHLLDPALLPRRLRTFIHEVSRLFLEGRILHESNAGTVTAIILQTLSKKTKTFFWGKQARTFGRVTDASSVRESLKLVQTVVRL